MYTGLNSSSILQLNSINGKETLDFPLPASDVATNSLEVPPLMCV